MAYVSDTRLRSVSNNEVDRMEKAEEADAEEEEKAEHAKSLGKFADTKESLESLSRVPKSLCDRIISDTGNSCRLQCRRFSRFVRVNVFNELKAFFLVSSCSVINRRSIRSEAALIRERVRHVSASPFVIHPFSMFRWLWEIGIIVACLIFLVLEPLHTTFYPDDHLMKFSDWKKQFLHHSVFFLDILFNLRTGLVQGKTDIVTLDGKKVFFSYLGGWFLVDLVSSLPMNGIYMLFRHENVEDDDKLFDTFRALSLTKLLLIFRLVRYLRRIETGFRLNGLEMRLVNLVVVGLLFLHWFACAHYFVPAMANEKLKEKSEDSWVTMSDLWESTVEDKYLHCLLRALSHAALIGFGFDTPHDREEIFVSIANILVGIILIAMGAGYVITVLMSLDVSERRYIEVTRQTDEYMRFNQIPKSLQQRVQDYFDQRYRKSYFNEGAILDLVSDTLRKELLMHHCQPLVEEVPLFHSINRTIISEIVARLEFDVYLPGDVIIPANTLGDCMYFIEHGTVSILAPEGRAMCTLHDGDFFGEMSMIFNEPRAATVLANSYCDIYRLSKLDFIEVIQPYPEIYEAIVKVAETRATRLDRSQLYKHIKRTDENEDASGNT